jgi:lysine 6-dehydrogenase
MSQTIGIAGVGEMGRATLAVLARHLPDATFVALDRSEDSLAAAERVAPGRVTGQRLQLGVEPPELPPADVLVNFAGPFYLGSTALARAALTAGIPYLDICDDVEGIRPVLALDADAKAAGVPLITGAGNSPGSSNLMAKRLLELHPDLDGIRVVWVVRDSDPGGLAPLRHMLHMAVTPCPIWQDGEYVHSKGFVPETARLHQLPQPLGEVTAFDTSHPEPITLPLAFPRLRHASCQGALRPVWANDVFSMLGRIGFGYHDLHVEVCDVEVEPAEVLWKLLWARHNRRHAEPAPGLTAVQVQGLVGDDQVIEATLIDPHSMVRTTALGAAAAVAAVLANRPPPGASGTEVLDAESTLALVERLAAAQGAIPGGITIGERRVCAAGRRS